MGSRPSHDEYADLLGRIEEAQTALEELRALEPSPARDARIELLQQALARAILALRNLAP